MSATLQMLLLGDSINWGQGAARWREVFHARAAASEQTQSIPKLKARIENVPLVRPNEPIDLCGFPDLHRAISTTRGNALTIRRPRQRQHAQMGARRSGIVAQVGV